MGLDCVSMGNVFTILVGFRRGFDYDVHIIFIECFMYTCYKIMSPLTWLSICVNSKTIDRILIRFSRIDGVICEEGITV